jgi:hypothetical protein
MNVDNPAARAQPVMDSFQDVHYVPGCDSSYGPRKQDDVETCGGQVNADRVPLSELHAIL